MSSNDSKPPTGRLKDPGLRHMRVKNGSLGIVCVYVGGVVLFASIVLFPAWTNYNVFTGIYSFYYSWLHA